MQRRRPAAGIAASRLGHCRAFQATAPKCALWSYYPAHAESIPHHDARRRAGLPCAPSTSRMHIVFDWSENRNGF
jgi:hypothetical protein